MSESGEILAIDQGTTTSKAVVVDAETGRVLARASRPVGISFPRPGWVEQDATALWESVRLATVECLDAVGRAPRAVAISNQRESVVAWRASTGEAVGPVLGWQDSRTAEWCASFAEHDEQVRRRTGLRLDPMFSAPKMRWLLDRARSAGVPQADLRLGTIDSWLVHRLTGEVLIEAGNASRTLLFSLAGMAWDPWLLELFGVPAEVLPRVRGSDEGFGVVSGVHPLLDGVPVTAVLADSHAALWHQGGGLSGVVKSTYGTGSSVMMATPRPAGGGVVAATLAWTRDGRAQYASEGNIVASGAALDWTARLLGAPEGVPGGRFLAELARDAPDSGGVSLVPAFSGLGAPHWDRHAVGLLDGLTGATSRAQVARAALEAVAHQVCDVVESFERADGGQRVVRLQADGGASVSPVLMQIQADVLGREVAVSAVPEASALGAAAVAARALGAPAWPPASPRARYEPELDEPGREARRRQWQTAVLRSRGRSVPR